MNIERDAEEHEVTIYRNNKMKMYFAKFVIISVNTRRFDSF